MDAPFLNDAQGNDADTANDNEVISADAVDFDKPLNSGEMADHGFLFEEKPMTRAAHRWLKYEAGISKKFGRELFALAVKEAESTNLQLNKEAMEKLLEKMYEEARGTKLLDKEIYQELLDRVPDETAPEKTVKCEWPAEIGCPQEFQPMISNIVMDGEVVCHKNGALAGEPIKKGDFIVFQGEEKAYPMALCLRHLQLLKESEIGRTIDCRTFPYAVAKARADQRNSDHEGVAFFNSVKIRLPSTNRRFGRSR